MVGTRVTHPHLATLAAAQRKVLRELSRTEGVKTAVISGRSLEGKAKKCGNKGTLALWPLVRLVAPLDKLVIPIYIGDESGR